MDPQVVSETAATFGPAALIVVSVVGFLREIWPREIDGKPRVFAACVLAAVAVIVWMQVRATGLPDWRAALVSLIGDVPPVAVVAFGAVGVVKKLRGG
ncbi:MAG: hypothetical protein EKK55_13735, partial [Rhodocyclaceae bacterium]